MIPSPFHALPRASKELDLDLRIKRDDLLPLPGGGNKARKILPIIKAALTEGATALVSNGGVQSNHARVVALTAAAHGMRCHLVLHGDGGELSRPRGNLSLMLVSGASVEVVASDSIPSAIAAAVEQLRARGERPSVVPGGGHSAAGASAFISAVAELAEQAEGWVPDRIVLASGTGTTQAGLAVGCIRMGWPSIVTGISVARQQDRGGSAVREAQEALAGMLGLDGPLPDVDFRDGWTRGGYERFDAGVVATIRWLTEREGIPLDPTYTAKAFSALLDLVGSGEIPAGSRVLFWHTGGLLNLTSSPCLDIPVS